MGTTEKSCGSGLQVVMIDGLTCSCDGNVGCRDTHGACQSATQTDRQACSIWISKLPSKIFWKPPSIHTSIAIQYPSLPQHLPPPLAPALVPTSTPQSHASHPPATPRTPLYPGFARIRNMQLSSQLPNIQSSSYTREHWRCRR